MWMRSRGCMRRRRCSRRIRMSTSITMTRCPFLTYWMACLLMRRWLVHCGRWRCHGCDGGIDVTRSCDCGSGVSCGGCGGWNPYAADYYELRSLWIGVVRDGWTWSSCVETIFLQWLEHIFRTKQGSHVKD